MPPGAHDERPVAVAPAERLTVLYDAKCRVCTRIAGRLAAMDRQHRLRLRPLQWAHRDEWDSVRRLRAERDLRLELHVIDESGAWASGGAAMLRALDRLPGLAPVAAVLRLPLLRRTVEPGYRWFAAHRARFAFLAGSFRNRSFGPP
jgi:predicted DCC family thiol-disulfide oxidoreductase YuxK